MYDTIIIGAGAAGITAAIYAARANMSFEIISKDVGGLTLWSSDIENYTGYHNLNGIQLVEKFKEHMKDYNINVKEDEVTKIEKKDDNFLVKTKNNQEFEAKTVIVTAGSSPRKLGVPGSEEYEGKGLFYCATCDGPLMAGKDVAVIGGGDAALDAVNTLINMGIKKISIINLNPEPTGTDKALKDKVINNEIVEVINNAKTTAVIGEQFVTAVKYEQDGTQTSEGESDSSPKEKKEAAKKETPKTEGKKPEAQKEVKPKPAEKPKEIKEAPKVEEKKEAPKEETRPEEPKSQEETKK